MVSSQFLAPVHFRRSRFLSGVPAAFTPPSCCCRLHLDPSHSWLQAWFDFDFSKENTEARVMQAFCAGWIAIASALPTAARRPHTVWCSREAHSQMIHDVQGEMQNSVVTKLHQILRPFLLRRLKQAPLVVFRLCDQTYAHGVSACCFSRSPLWCTYSATATCLSHYLAPCSPARTSSSRSRRSPNTFSSLRCPSGSRACALVPHSLRASSASRGLPSVSLLHDVN